MASRPRLSTSSRTSSLDVPMELSPSSSPRGCPIEISGRGSTNSGRFLAPERGRMVQQKSSESQDSTASAISMLSMEDTSTPISTASSSPNTKIDLINKKNSPLDKESSLEAGVSSSKGIWKRAFFSMKKDKATKAQAANKKRDSKVPIVTETPREETEEVDPVYHLLRCAASKAAPTGPQTTKCGTNNDDSRGTSPASELHRRHKVSTVSRTASMPSKRSNTGPISPSAAGVRQSQAGNKLTRGASVSASSPPPSAHPLSAEQQQGNLLEK